MIIADAWHDNSWFDILHRVKLEAHLRSAVDDVNLMQGHDMHHFFAFLQLTLRTLDKLGGWACTSTFSVRQQAKPFKGKQPMHTQQ